MQVLCQNLIIGAAVLKRTSVTVGNAFKYFTGIETPVQLPQSYFFSSKGTETPIQLPFNLFFLSHGHQHLNLHTKR